MATNNNLQSSQLGPVAQQLTKLLSNGHQAATQQEPNTSKDEISKASSMLFNHIEGQINLADTKAQLTLAADAVLSLAFAPMMKGAALDLLANSTPILDRFVALFTIIMLLSLVCSFYCALLVVRPHLRKSQHPNLMFFGQIIQSSEDVFINKFLTQGSNQLKESVLTEVYSKARIAKSKFTKIYYSINFLIIALVIWAIVQLLQAFV